MSAPNVPPQAPAPMPNPPAPAPAPMPPAAAAPSTELPRHHVHHSYIWLESVRTIFIIAVCVVVANFSTIIGLVAEEGMGAEAGFIMAVAGIGTLVVIVICALTYLLGEDYLADIAVIYVVMSFIAVMMLCRIYINLYDRRRKEKEQHDR